MFMESWILRISCKVNVKPFGLHLQETRSIHDIHEPSKTWIHFLSKTSIIVEMLTYDISNYRISISIFSFLKQCPLSPEKLCYILKHWSKYMPCWGVSGWSQNHIWIFHKCHWFMAIDPHIWAATCDFQQWGILTSEDSDELVQPPFMLRNSKWCSVSSLIFTEYSGN